MSIRYLSVKNFNRLSEKLKAKMRIPIRTREPWETEEAFRDRCAKELNEVPQSITYYGRFHTIEFYPKRGSNEKT